MLPLLLFVAPGLLPLRSQPTGEPFSFTCKEVSPMGTSWHSSQRQSLCPYAIYCIYSTFLMPNVSLDPSGASPFFLCRCPGTRYRKRGTAEPPLQGVALPCRSGGGREVGEYSPGLYTASFFLRTDDTGAGMSPDSYGSIYYM